VSKSRQFLRAAYRVLASVVLNWENPAGLDRPLFYDFSHWQLVVNMAIAKAMGAFGMISRATNGTATPDDTFQANWLHAYEQGMYRASYHVLRPSQPLVAQVDNWYKANPTIDTLPRWIDLELHENQAPEKIATMTWEVSEIVQSRDGALPGIYGRYLLINQWLSPFWTADMLNKHWWWLAQYTADRIREHAGPPTLPNKVLRERVFMHQTADKKPDPPGMCSGSATVDHDRLEVCGNDEVHTWIAQNFGGSAPPPPPPVTIIQPIKKVRVTANLNVRSSASSASADLGTLKYGSIVPVIESVSGWYRASGWFNASSSYVVPLENSEHVKVIVSALNMRSGPGVAFVDLGEVFLNTDMTIVEQYGEWGRFDGWISKSYAVDL